MPWVLFIYFSLSVLCFLFLAASLLWACIWILLSYTQPWHYFPNWVLPTLLKSSSKLHKRFFTCFCGIKRRTRPLSSDAFTYWNSRVSQWIWRRRLFKFCGNISTHNTFEVVPLNQIPWLPYGICPASIIPLLSDCLDALSAFLLVDGVLLFIADGGSAATKR